MSCFVLRATALTAQDGVTLVVMPDYIDEFPVRTVKPPLLSRVANLVRGRALAARVCATCAADGACCGHVAYARAQAHRWPECPLVCVGLQAAGQPFIGMEPRVMVKYLMRLAAQRMKLWEGKQNVVVPACELLLHLVVRAAPAFSAQPWA